MNTSSGIYVDKASVVHSCRAGVKIVLLMAYSVGIFFVDTWWGMGVYAACALGAAAASRISVGTYAKPLVPVYVLMAFTLLFNGLDPGVFFALRIFLLALASFIVCFTTTPAALVRAFAFGLGPLRALKVPVDDIATTLGLSLRFMPLMAAEAKAVRDAQWCRGASFGKGGPMQRLTAWGNVFIPLFVGLFRHAQRLAGALDARCFGMPGVRPAQLPCAVGGVSVATSAVALAVGLAVLIAAAVLC
ncbi:MAG: energy-coupling factor transporter transmembrane component T [Coriobacteriia bacterium]|nr:energy-coupling factor transporter transmembrane component T [Coriobacteriia bacterium]